MDLVPGILGALSLPHRLKPQDGDEQSQEAVEQMVAKAILPDSSEEQSESKFKPADIAAAETLCWKQPTIKLQIG